MIAVLPPPPPDSAAFVVRRGADTVSIERTRRNGDVRNPALTADVLDVHGGGRLAITAALGPGALISRLEVRAWRPGMPANVAPALTAIVSFRGDSVYADGQAVATTAGALPYYNVVVSLLEQIVRRARVLGATRGPVDVPVFVLAAGGRTVPARVTPVGADSVTVAFAGTELRFRVDAAGTILGGHIPAQGVEIDRVTGSAVPRRRTGG